MSLIRRFVDIKETEGRALAWSWLYIFSLFLAYYILRPIREELGVEGGIQHLPWLFSGTLLAMLALNPLFGYVVKNWTRKKLIAISYRFFTANLLIFMLLFSLLPAGEQIWVGRAFFIWVSVFNVFVISIFWSFIVDVFNHEQGKRLFGFLAAGATVGGIFGSAITSLSAGRVGSNWLILGSMFFLELAVYASGRLEAGTVSARGDEKIGGHTFAGITRTFRSPYLLGIAGFVLLYSLTSTVLYFQQASIAQSNFADRASRTAFFANIDLWVNALTLVFQIGLTAKLMRWVGVMGLLCALPLLTTIGFALLGFWPSVAALVFVQVAGRVCNFALSNPALEILFTSVAREDRYKAKNFIDTVIYRSGDQAASWVYAGFLALGLSSTGIAFLAVPVSLFWLALSFWLGLRERRVHGG